MTDVVIARRKGVMFDISLPTGDLTVREAAQQLNVHTNTIKRLIKSGEITGVYRLGRELRIPRASLQEYKEKNKVS